MVCLRIARTSAETIKPDFTIEGLRRRCAPKHRNSHRETAGWDRIDRQGVFVLCFRQTRDHVKFQSVTRLAKKERGRGRQAMHLPCKQVDVGALPTDSTI